MVKQYKIDKVNALKEKISNAKHFVFTDYKGLTVEEMQTLKNELRKHNVEYRVVKNTYLKIAMDDNKVEVDESVYKGPIAVAFFPEDVDVTEPVKVFYKFIKDKNKLVIKSSVIDGQIFDDKGLEAISKLPSKAELIAKLIGSLKSPISRLHNVLNGIIIKLPLVLKQIEKQKAEDK